MACHGFAGAHLWDHHPIESGLQDFRRPFTLSHSPLPLNYARQRDRTGRLLILILIVILLGLGSWRLRVRLRLRLGRNHSALIQWQGTPALSPRRGGSTHSSRNFHALYCGIASWVLTSAATERPQRHLTWVRPRPPPRPRKVLKPTRTRTSEIPALSFRFFQAVTSGFSAALRGRLPRLF